MGVGNDRMIRSVQDEVIYATRFVLGLPLRSTTLTQKFGNVCEIIEAARCRFTCECRAVRMAMLYGAT